MSADPQLVSQLKALGISENTAKYALLKCKNDVQRAADFAFSGAAAKDEVSKSKSKKSGRSPSPLKTVTEAVVVASPDSSGLSPGRSSLKARSGSVGTASSSAGQVIVPLKVDAGVEILNTPPSEVDPSDVPTSKLPTSSSQRWVTVLGLGKLSRKRGSVKSLTVDGRSDVAESPCDISPAPSVSSSGWSEAGDEGNQTRGRSRSKEEEKIKNPIRRLTLTRSDSSSSNTTFTADSRPVSHQHANDELSKQASQLILQAFDRGGGTPNASSTSLNLPPSTSPTTNKRSSTSSALAALGLRAAAMGGSAISSGPPAGSNPSLPPNDLLSTNPKSTYLQKSKPVGSSKANKEKRTDEDNPQERPGRAPSPFFRVRQSRSKQRARDRSPEVGALEKDRDTGPESDGESVVATRDRTGSVTKFRPQASAYENDATEDEAMTDDSADEYEKDVNDDDGLDEDGLEIFDDETEKNTVANAVFFEGDAGGLGGMGPGDYVVEDDGDPETTGPTTGSAATLDKRDDVNLFGEEIEFDPLGEGPNVIVPPEPLFATPTARNQGKRKTMKSGLELVTSRPAFGRDRCTITLTHGEPDEALEESGKRLRRYVVLSDISEESTYAVEWAIGTVARDGDEVYLVTVKEDESKVDPKNPADQDRATRLRVQKERQTQALLLVRQVTGLLQRTRLNITVTCQALHAKNARYMLLDLIDFLEPTMVIVGSRGLGKLKGILLGSTSHYLVQKSSVPVMVARRRLQRPMRKTNPANLRHSPRVSLASASIEKTPSSKQEDDVMDVAVTEGVSDKESGNA